VSDFPCKWLVDDLSVWATKLFLFSGLSQRRPDNGRQSQPNFSLRTFSITQMTFPEGNNRKLNWRSCSSADEGGTIGADRSPRVVNAGTDDADAEAALIGTANSTACPTDHVTLRLIIRTDALRRHSRLAGSGCVGVGRLQG
jgi:hypothetical protein